MWKFGLYNCYSWSLAKKKTKIFHSMNIYEKEKLEYILQMFQDRGSGSRSPIPLCYKKQTDQEIYCEERKN